MKRIAYITILVILACFLQNAFCQSRQKDFFVDCSTQSLSTKESPLSDTIFRTYIPYTYQDNVPIRVNLVFIQDDDGHGSFRADNAEHQRLWKEIEERVNYMFSNFSSTEAPACYAWKDPFLKDARIRLVFNHIYIQDDDYWDWSQYGNSPYELDSLLKYLKTDIDSDPNIPLGINIFFSENAKTYKTYQNLVPQNVYTEPLHEGWAYSFFPSSFSIPWIHMPDTYCKFIWMKYLYKNSPEATRNGWTWEENIWYMQVNSLAAGIAHEMGHSLGLDHHCSHYKTNTCTVALMNQGYDSERNRSYIPPTEIGRIHKNLSTKKNKDVVPKDLPTIHEWSITNYLNWPAPYFRSYGNIQIEKPGQLVTEGDLYMPIKSRIDVTGHLYIRDGDVACVLEDGPWNGIRVKEGGVLWLENTTVSDYDIVMEPGSTLVLKGKLNVTNNHKIVVGEGCYVCASSDFQVTGSSKPFSRMGSTRSGIKPGTVLLYNNTCDASGWTRFYNASSSISNVLYVQNQQITSDQTFVAKEIVVGSNVTSTKPSGQVTIKNGAKATFISQDGTRFDKGFRCDGGTFKVLKSEE